MPRGVYIKTEEHKQKLSKILRENAYKPGHCPWNKGLKSPQEVKDKISKNRKGKCLGGKNPRWKGGQYIDRGYVYIFQPNHPFASKRDKYVRRSRLIMEKMLGRYLEPTERVHHKGIKYPFHSIENKQDDTPENLELFNSESIHQSHHWKLKKSGCSS